MTANELQLLGSRADSEGGFGGGGYGAAAGAGGRAWTVAGPSGPGGQPGSIEEVPWDDGEPPF